MATELKHPGVELAEWLKSRGVKQVHVARQIKMAQSQFNEVLRGKRSLTAQNCVNLQRLLGVGLLLWKKQNNYDWQPASQKALNYSA